RDVTLPGGYCRRALVCSITGSDIACKRRAERARRVDGDAPGNCYRLPNHGWIRKIGIDCSCRVCLTNRHRVVGWRVVRLITFREHVPWIDFRDTTAGSRILI